MPATWATLRHAAPIVFEGVLAPLAVFYTVLVLTSFRGALLGCLAWSYLALARRLVHHQRVSTLLLLGTALLTLRTLVSFITGSAFMYFIQPTAAAFIASMLLVVSALASRPFTQRFTHDFCPLDAEFLARPAVHRFFVRISFLWAIAMFLNGAFVLWLLTTQPVGAFVLERTMVSVSLTATAIFLSVVWFARAMRRDGVTVQFGGRPRTSLALPVPELAR